MKIHIIQKTACEEIVDITKVVEEYATENRIKDGFIHLQVPEETTALTMLSNIEDIDKDFFNKLNHFMPKYDGMRFTGFGTSAIKASITGKQLIVSVAGGFPVFGLKQRVCFVEFAGPAEDRHVFISHVGTTMESNETATIPKDLEKFLDSEKDKNNKMIEEEKRIIEEMRAENKALREKHVGD